MADNLELCNVRGMYREGLLNADTVRDTSDGNGLVDAAMLHSDNGTLEDLNSFAVTFLDLSVYLDGIADLELRQVGLDLLVCENLNSVHRILLLSI